MPRYFFNLQSGEPDILGSELPDFATAKREAIRFFADLMHYEADKTAEWSMNVTDITNAVVLSISCKISGSEASDTSLTGSGGEIGGQSA